MWKLRLTEGRPFPALPVHSTPSRSDQNSQTRKFRNVSCNKSHAVAETKISSNTLKLIVGKTELTPSILV
jgi:hypothetical protein